MTVLLWFLVTLGGWNLLSALARVWCQERQAPQFYWIIALGAWAAYLLAHPGAC